MNLILWLHKTGYKLARNVKINGRTPNFVAFNDNEAVVFETKKDSTKILTVIEHCLRYLTEAIKVYIIIQPGEDLFQKEMDLLKSCGIGLVENSDPIRIILKPKKNHSNIVSLLEKLKENQVSPYTLLSKPKEELHTERSVKDKIIDLLMEYPEGLTTVDIAKALNVHRHTVTRYVYELVGAGIISQRKIGPAKLNYVKKEAQGITEGRLVHVKR